MKSVYIHIPFCNNMCSYCDFTKLYYNKKFVEDYINSLEQEIINNYKNEIIETIYIGGGTPDSLSVLELEKLFNIIKIFKTNNLELTVECNVENICLEKLELFKKNNVNRLSIGVQTFNANLIKYLNRKHNKEEALKNISLAHTYIPNINIDLIYAVPGETIDDLEKDIDEFIKLDIEHISTYSLILEPHTKLYIDNTYNIDDDLDFKMYDLICSKLEKNNYNHYEISNFSKKGYESKHNLTYWNNNKYYGFGLGASGYINNTRYTNTKNIIDYNNKLYIKEQEELNLKNQMQEEMFLGLRKISGIDISLFKNKFNLNVEEVFDIEKLLKEKKLIKEKGFIKISKEYLYLSNDILINFVGE